jgi:hypothetical protein
MVFFPTVITHIKNACSSRGNLQDRTLVHEILEVSTQHFILSPAIRSLYKYLHLPMEYKFAPSNAIVYISSRYCNYLCRTYYRATLKIRLCPILFPTLESLRVLRPLMETLQSVATIKCALGHFVYNDIKHSYKI